MTCEILPACESRDDSPARVSVREYRDADFSPQMVKLSAGEFIMGENAGDKFATDTERPAHCVKILAGFALGRVPVTAGEFRRFRACHTMEDPDQLPVVRVTWHDALAYCEWLTAKTGREYRLPSESEWEFGCRAGSRGPFANGDEISGTEANYLYEENGTRVGCGERTPVGSFPANCFGLQDMHGNVCEWVADGWHPDYIGAPADGSARIATTEAQRVIRGGAWDYLPRLLRSSWRDWRLADERVDNIGFRVASSDLKAVRIV